MDITIDVEEYKLNVRAAGIIIHNNKILTHRNTKSDHYALIGGRVEIGEDSVATLKSMYMLVGKRNVKKKNSDNFDYNGFESFTIE